MKEFLLGVIALLFVCGIFVFGLSVQSHGTHSSTPVAEKTYGLVRVSSGDKFQIITVGVFPSVAECQEQIRQHAHEIDVPADVKSSFLCAPASSFEEVQTQHSVAHAPSKEEQEAYKIKAFPADSEVCTAFDTICSVSI